MKSQRFHPFRRLPPEIKRMIWDKCVHDEHDQPGVQFFTLYTKPGYLCDCEVCSRKDVAKNGVSVSLPHCPSSKARQHPEVRDELLHQRYVLCSHNPRYATQSYERYRVFNQAVPLAAAREFADFHQHRDAYLNILVREPSAYEYVFQNAQQLTTQMLRPAALTYHGVPSQELGIPPRGGSLPCPSHDPGNPSAYLINGALWDMDDIAQRSVMMHRKREEEARRIGGNKGTNNIVPLETLPQTNFVSGLCWNPHQDLICLRPDRTLSGEFATDLDDLEHIPLIKCMLRYGRQVALAIEFDPEWSTLENTAMCSVYKELVNLANSLVHSLPTRKAKERVLYFIDWRISPRDRNSMESLGAPSYRGRGVNFYEMFEWTSRLQGSQTARHGNHFDCPGMDIVNLIGYVSNPSTLRGQRHLSIRILAAVRT